MKFKALRRIEEPQDFIHIDVVDNVMVVYSSDLPQPKPLSIEMEHLKTYYHSCKTLPNQIGLDEMELVEIEFFDAGVVGADIRNKLGPCKNLCALVKNFIENLNSDNEDLKKVKVTFIKSEIEKSEKNIKYISELL